MEAEEQTSQVAVAAAQVGRIARMGDRIVAVFLDLLVLFPLFFLAIAAIGLATGKYKDGNATLDGWPALLAISLIVLAWIAYHFVTEFFYAGTPGKLVMGIEVLSGKGGRITLAQSLVRNLVRPIDAFGFYALGFVIALCSNQGRRLGDMAADTLVVEKEHSRRVLALEILIGLVAASYLAAWVFTRIVR